MKRHLSRERQSESLEPRVVLAAVPVISEFQTHNRSTIVDGHGFHSNWVEMSNTSDEEIDLAGWYLTDDLTRLRRWQFPTTILKPGDSVVVFTAGNPAATETELSADIELDNEDEYLALLSPVGAIQQAFDITPQQADVSFGTRLDTGGTTFFQTPTPGAPNGMPAAPSPKILTSSGIFVGEKQVSMESEGPDLQIRYTLDGSAPTMESALYVDPLVLTESALMQAVAFDVSANPAFEPSVIVSASLVAVSEDLSAADSNLPIAIVDVSASGEDDITGGWYSATRTSAIGIFDVSADDGRSKIDESNLDFFGRSGILRWGGSEFNQPKPNMYVRTLTDEGSEYFDTAQESLLGMSAGTEYLFYAPYEFDQTMIKYQLMFELSRQVGIAAPELREVEVYYNYDDGIVDASDYHGVYLIIQWPNPNGRNTDFEIASRFDAPEDGGYVLSTSDFDYGGIPRDSFGDVANAWMAPRHPDDPSVDLADRATVEQQTYLHDYFKNLRTALRDPDINDPEGYSKYVNVESLVSYHQLQLLSKNPEGLRRDRVVSIPKGGQLEFGPLWDLDRIINSKDLRSQDPEEWHGRTQESYFSGNWWSERYFRDPGMWQAYVDRWQELRRSVYHADNIAEIANRHADRLREAQARNFERWPAVLTSIGWEEEISQTVDWLKKRIAFVDKNLPSPVDVTVDGAVTVSDSDHYQLPVDKPFQLSANTHANKQLLTKDSFGYYTVPSDDSLGTEWLQPEYDVAGWTLIEGGVGFAKERDDFFEFVETEVFPSDVVPQATTLATRYAFDAVEFVENDELWMRLRYNDGFVAYINGVEVARSNVDGNPTWNSQATTSRRDSDVAEFQEFDLSQFRSLINAPSNVLAIQVVNWRSDDGRIFLQPELVRRTPDALPLSTATVYYTLDGTDPRAPDGTVSPSAIAAGLDTIQLSEDETVIARTLDETPKTDDSGVVDTEWSGRIFVSAANERVIGDSNGDGIFDSSDFVAVFIAGEYEDDVENNSTFEEGDWNGDGDFDSSDFVLAFQAGTYVRKLRPTHVDSLFAARQDERRFGARHLDSEDSSKSPSQISSLGGFGMI
ncbi:CotH kinase family protein [Planctomycetota bacterium]